MATSLTKQGTWNLFGFNIPDLGLTEAAGAQRGNNTFYNPAVFQNGGTNVMPVTGAQRTQVGGRATTQAHLDPTKGGTVDVLGARDEKLSGGGGGGGSNSNNSGDAAKEAAAGEDAALLSRLKGEFDYNADRLRGQQSFAESERNNAMNMLSGQETDLRNRTAAEEARSKEAVESAIGDAGQTARNVQRENRNILRALGILSSSAAGEMLGKPVNEFDKERARLTRVGIERVNELKSFLDSGLSQLNNARQQVQAQYDKMVADIQRDLRFNDFQRSQAIMEANAALKSRFAEIDNATRLIAGQVSTAQNQIVQALQQQEQYQAPTAQTGNITAMGINPQIQGGPMTAGIYGQEEDRKLSDIYA